MEKIFSTFDLAKVLDFIQKTVYETGKCTITLFPSNEKIILKPNYEKDKQILLKIYYSKKIKIHGGNNED